MTHPAQDVVRGWLKEDGTPPLLWVVMPVMGGEALTDAAISDVLAQSIPTRLLIIAQGVHWAWRQHLQQVAEESDGRVLIWWHDPPLPSLSASWNRALRFVWSTGAEEALVINNDTRIDEETCGLLRSFQKDTEALFLSAVGVTGEQFAVWDRTMPADGGDRGGPDFSCFLITKEGHEKYPFDENFIPAYGEDCSCHREYMLGGDGDRIFSINLPFHHVDHGSGTLKSMTPEARAKHERKIGGSREYYKRKWGPGGINHETFTIPFDPTSAQEGVTNPELQRLIQAREVLSCVK